MYMHMITHKSIDFKVGGWLGGRTRHPLHSVAKAVSTLHPQQKNFLYALHWLATLTGKCFPLEGILHCEGMGRKKPEF